MSSLKINIASVMLGLVYGTHVDKATGLHTLTPEQDFGLKIAAPLGSIFGQLFFGWLADRLGRKRMCTYILDSVDCMYIMLKVFKTVLNCL